METAREVAEASGGVSMNENLKQVRVARIGKPHGIRGDVTVEVFTDSPQTRFQEGSLLTVQREDNQKLPFKVLTVENARWNKRILLLKFKEFSDRNTAESLRNSQLYALAEDPLDDDEGWYPNDLIGLTVHEGSFDSAKIGEVADLITGEAQDLLEIHLTDGREVLIPFVEEIVPEIDEEQGAIVITPPPGLLELT